MLLDCMIPLRSAHFLSFLLITLLLIRPGTPNLYTGMSSSGSSSIRGSLGPDKPSDASESTSANASKGHLPLDVEGYPVAPLELELQQVHIYMRHGERTPVGVRMADPPASIPAHWTFCKTARDFRASVASGSPYVPGAPKSARQDGTGYEEALPTRRIVEWKDGSVAPGECLLGELTDIGRQSTYNFGKALRQLYIDRLGFLPDVACSNDEIYLRSTNVPRTIESLQQTIHGLYPVSKSSDDFTPQLRIRNSRDENLFGNTLACKRLEILQSGFAQAAAAEWNDTLAPLDKKISKYLGGNPIRLDGKPRASGILDTLMAAEAHGITVPSEFREPGVTNVIEKAVVHEWFADKTEEVRKLGMGPLLSDLSSKLQAKAERGEQDPLKILIHSTHDTSIAGLCSTLDVFDEKWPSFASAVTFELFKLRPQSDSPHMPVWQRILAPFQRLNNLPKHYVRVRYQNQNLRLPLCADEGKHLPSAPEFCALDAFRERVQQLTPMDWEAECAPAGQSF
ncbi:hypothetical protein AcV7_001582 [Taiwanofungus camphoratus]|nr:hypothetical protein AcV7_001582 [Antrodia cinnamomea]